MRNEYGYNEDEKLGNPYDVKLLKRLLPFVQPFWRLFAASVCLVMMITVLDLSLPYMTKIAIDRYIVPGAAFHPAPNAPADTSATGAKTVETPPPPGAANSHRDDGESDPVVMERVNAERLEGLAGIAFIFLLLILLNYVLNFVQNLVMEYTGQSVMHDLRLRLYDHIQHLSVGYFSKNPTGRLVTRVTNDVGNMHDLFTSVVTFLFKDIFLLVGISAVLLAMNWRLALISFAVMPVVIYASLSFSRQAREAFRILRVKIAEINTRFSETILGIRVIQLFLQQAENYKRFKALNHEYYQAGMRQVHVFALFMPVIELLGMTVMAVVILFGGSGVIKGRITLGELVAFITYMKIFFRPIRDISEKYNIMQNAMASSERIFMILDTHDPDGYSQAAVEDHRDRGTVLPPGSLTRIDFDRVTFAYNEGEPVLEAVSFSIYKGESLAIVGPTGSGKTTLISLLMRFYDAVDGGICINGIPIENIPLPRLRSRMSLVMQDPFLFSGTIRKNLVYGNPDISEHRLAQIVSEANLGDLVDELPSGLETVLAEGGRSISSGERQLISIARAFAGNPDLIIFDEATSYIDSETEAKIQDAIAKLMAGRTAVMVAHRLSTAKHADRIIVVNRGRITESGTHNDLMNAKGFYFNLHQLQNAANSC